MNHRPDPTTAENGGHFDPQRAATLLNLTTQQARRKLEPTPPWLLVTRAVMVLAACGAVWLSVRGQHPYRGPTTADIPVLIAFIVINFTATAAVAKRATVGVTGRSRLRPAEITVAALAWIAAAAVVGALAAAGVSYSLYPTTLLIVPGVAWAAVMAARADWAQVRYRARGSRRRCSRRVRGTGRGMGSRSRRPLPRPPRQRRRRCLATARMTVRHG